MVVLVSYITTATPAIARRAAKLAGVSSSVTRITADSKVFC
jgi:hypothetical protein